MTLGITQGTAMLWAPLYGWLGDRMSRMTHFTLAFGLALAGYCWVGLQDDIVRPAAVPALMKVVEVSADEQDFFLNREAAKHLGEFADARSAGTLVRGLFMTGRGGDIFVPCRYALARIGEPAVDKVVEAGTAKDIKDVIVLAARSKVGCQ